jgi:predicted O-linked N-acetylglucosamine transferase (SPINDLY family)
MQASIENALKHYQQALLRNPKDLEAQINCGNLCIELQRYEEAVGYFRRLLRILKTNVDVRNALCYALQALGNESHAVGRYSLAEACFSEALEYQPANAAYWYNLGNAQRELGKSKDALVSFKQSIKCNPNDADAYNNLGNIQRELGMLDLAIASYEHALKLNPALYHAKVHLVHQKQHICDWQGLEDDIATIRHWVKTVPEAQVSPFAFLAMPTTTAAEQKLCANHWVKNRYAGLIASNVGRASSRHVGLKPDLQNTHQKIKIGYLSADFRLHPLAFLVSELIELHDRTQFEIIAFSYGVNDKTSERTRLEKAFDQFHDVRNLSEIDAAKKIQACDIDILVDLTGFTQTSRTGIAALRPAPININWLGFPGTMGEIVYKNHTQPLFDYLLTDRFITPTDSAQHYAEQFAFLPDCYQPNDSKRPVGKTPTRLSCHLPEGAFVFCCFNQTFKITPNVFTIWLRLLKAVPNSVLWLLDCNRWAKDNLIRVAAAQGVASEKLIFAPRIAIVDHLARHSHADLFLDTLPYNAHTTCSDALWMGVPVLTCVGNTFSARVAGSLLTTLNLTELITYSLQDYEDKAFYYATNHAALTSIKRKLLENNTQSPLFDSRLFARSLEEIYQTLLKRHLNMSDSNKVSSER